MVMGEVEEEWREGDGEGEGEETWMEEKGERRRLEGREKV